MPTGMRYGFTPGPSVYLTQSLMPRFLIFFLLLVTPRVVAQHSLQGKVTDAHSGAPLSGVSITVAGTYKGAVTDYDGRYTLSGLRSGEYTLVFSSIGYEKLEQKTNLSGNATLDIQLQPRPAMIDEVEIIATRVTEKTPVTQTTLSGDELRKNNLGQDLPILLDQSPSVVVNSDAGNGVGYTGIRIRGNDITRTNVTINGIPVNDAESQGVFWVNMPDLVSSVSNIQIQRGVGTSTNGAGSFGATININTNELRPYPFAQVSSSIGFYNTFKNTIEVGSGLIGKHFAFTGRLSKITSDGYVDRGWSDLKSFFVSGGYYGKKTVVKFNIFSGKEATYQAWYGVPEYMLDTARTFNVAGTDYFQKPVPYANETDNYQQDHYQLFVNQQIGRYVHTNLALYYTRGRGYYEEYKVKDNLADYGLDSLFIGTDTVTTSDLVRQLWLDNHLYGFNASANYNRGRVNITGGAGWNNYTGDHYGKLVWMEYAGATQPGDRYYTHDASKMDLNVYVKAEVQIIRQLSVFADMQYRMVNYQINGFKNNPGIQVHDIFHFFNPKFGLTYDMNSSNRFFAYFGIANKEPNRVDYETSATDKPRYETLRDLEIGYQHRSRRFTVAGNFFWMDYTNQLVQTGKINDVGAYTRTNAPSSYRLGIEISGAVNILKSLKLSANFTFSQNKIRDFTEFIDNYDTGVQDTVRHGTTDISFSPDFISGFTLSWSPVKRLEMDITGKFVSRQFMDNTSNTGRSLDPYFTNNFQVRYTLPIKKMFEIGFNLVVNNFTNRMYAPNGYTFSYTYGGTLTTENWYYPQAGINMMGGITLRFEKKD